MTATGMDEPQPARASAPPTLAQSLQSAPDEHLAELFAQRPDLVRQLPDDFSSLAAACSSPPSVRLAWLRLNRLQHQVLEVLASHQRPLARESLVGLLDPDGEAAEHVERAVAQLRRLALIWGDDGALRAVSGVASVVGPTPCGLDPTDRSGSLRISRYLSRPEELFDELALAPAGARKVLDKLLWGPPRGSVANADRPVSASSARTPIEWLLARELLVAADRDAVVLPREVALLMRGGRYVRHLAVPPDPPATPGASPIGDVDQVAGMHALLFTRSVEELLARLDGGEVRLLRSGGIYQRDAVELSRQLRLTPAQTALVADVALGAGLIGPDHESGVWRLSRTADLWRSQPEPRRWAALALAWRSSAAHTALASAPGGEGRMLSEDLNAPGIAEVRQTALRLAATVAPGIPVDVAALADSVTWVRPRLTGRDLPAVLAEILADGEAIGLLGRTCLSRAGRAAADPATDAASLAGAVAWPALVDQVLLQADLTATAPGPMTERAQRRLALLADVESSGGGAVYRISAASLNRGLDAGLTASELLAEFRELSATPVPSTLEVLIADVGRRHGSVRVHVAASVLTADDEAALSSALADKALARLGLRRVAPTVALSGSSPAEVVAALRASGVSAVSAHAAVPGRSPRVLVRRPVVTEALDPQYLAAAVRSIRAGEAAKAALDGPDRVAPVTPHELVDVLSQAIRDQVPIWLDFTDPSGQRKVRMVDPLTLRHGQLSGFDHREQRVVAFPLSRIAGVAVVDRAEPA